MKDQYFKVWQPVYEGEEGGGDAASGDDSGAGGAAVDAGTPQQGQTVDRAIAGVEFSPEQQKALNTILSKEKKKHQDAVNKAIAEAQAASKKAQMTAKERQDLEQRLEQLQDQLMTKEQLARKQAERQKQTYEEQVSTLKAEKDSWQQRYTESTIQRSLTDAAAQNNAFSPRQIVAILGRDTRLVEVLDSQGKPTGQLEPRVRFTDVDKDGESVVLELSPKEAVKRMREIPDYLNLFKGEGTGGAGLRSQPGGRKPAVRELAKDAAAYREARKRGEVRFQ